MILTYPQYITEKAKRDSNPCWPGYTQLGTKIKNGKTVPNCVDVDDKKTQNQKQK
jgi:hypothetical protein